MTWFYRCAILVVFALVVGFPSIATSSGEADNQQTYLHSHQNNDGGPVQYRGAAFEPDRWRLGPHRNAADVQFASRRPRSKRPFSRLANSVSRAPPSVMDTVYQHTKSPLAPGRTNTEPPYALLPYRAEASQEGTEPVIRDMGTGRDTQAPSFSFEKMFPNWQASSSAQAPDQPLYSYSARFPFMPSSSGTKSMNVDFASASRQWHPLQPHHYHLLSQDETLDQGGTLIESDGKRTGRVKRPHRMSVPPSARGDVSPFLNLPSQMGRDAIVFWTPEKIRRWVTSPMRGRYREPRLLKALPYSIPPVWVWPTLDRRTHYVPAEEDERERLNNEVFAGRLEWIEPGEAPKTTRWSNRHSLFGPNRVVPFFQPAPLDGVSYQVRMTMHPGIEKRTKDMMTYPSNGRTYYSFWGVPERESDRGETLLIRKYGVGRLDPLHFDAVDRHVLSLRRAFEAA